MFRVLVYHGQRFPIAIPEIQLLLMNANAEDNRVALTLVVHRDEDRSMLRPARHSYRSAIWRTKWTAMLGGQVFIGTAMIGFTVAIHVGGIVALTAWLRSRFLPILGPETFSTILAIRLIVFTVYGAFFLHAIEIWSWAFLYLLLGQFDSLERSVYFSTVTFTTLGYGDITLEPRWQLLSGFEAINGVVLLGVTTAYVFAVLLYIVQTAGIVK
jgi:hypothetical protein